MPPLATFLISLKKIIPETAWSWVVSALRQDSQIWQCLHDPEFFDKALSEFGSDLEKWSPAGMSFLSLGIPLPSLTSALDPELNLQAIQTLESLAYPQERQPVTQSAGLAKAGLVGVALLENRRKSKSWSFLPAVLEQSLASTDDPVQLWGTSLGVVYGLVDDRLAFLKALIRPGVPDAYYRLALHALLSNPRKPADHEQILIPFIQDLPFADSARLARLLGYSRPELAERLAHRLLDHRQTTSHRKKSVATHYPANQLADLLVEADIHQLAGENEEAIELRSKALSLARDLQVELARNLIQKNLTAGDLSKIQKDWNQVVIGPVHAAPPASIIVELLKIDLIKEAQELLTQASLSEDHPFRWLIAAQLAEERGDRINARQAARHCLKVLTEQVVSGSQLQLNDPGGLSTQDLVSVLVHLRDFLIDLSLHNEAARAAHLAGTLQPLNAALLEGESLACRLAGEPENAVACAHLAVALQPEAASCRRELAASLEANEDWSAALAERVELMENRFAPPSEIYWPAPADWHAMAACAIQAGDTETAINASQSALNLNPEDGLAQALMGDALLAQGLSDQAMERFHLATQQAPHQPAPWLSLASAYQKSGQSDKSIETLRAASHAVPDHPQILYALAEAYLAEDTPTQAQAALARAHQIISTSTHASNHSRSKLPKGSPIVDSQFTWNRDLPCQIAMAYGHILHQLGHTNQASRVYESAYQAYPAYPGLAYAYGKALISTGETQAALAPLIVAVGSKPKDPQPYIDYAQTLLSLQESPEEAVQALQQALQVIDELESDSTGITLDSADQSPAPSAQTDPSITPASPISKGNPGVSTQAQATPAKLQAIRLSAQTYLAEALEATGDLTSSLKAFSQALESGFAASPEWNVRLSLGMGRVALRQGQPEIAIAALQEISRSEMNNSLIQQTLAEAYATIHLPEEALQAAHTAVQIAPDNTETLSWFASLCTRIDAHREAVPALTRAIQLDPNDASLAVRLGQVLLHLRENEAAQHAFLQVIENPNTTYEQLEQAGDGFTKLGDSLAAINAIERACKSKSVINPALLLRLARLYEQAGIFTQALESIERAIQADNTDASLHFYKASLLSHLGRLQAAQASLEHALNLQPGNPAFHLHLAILLRHQGSLMEALAHADTAVAATHESPEHPIARIACGLAADLSRALLQPELARRYLFGKSQSFREPFQLDDAWSQTLAAQSFSAFDQAIYSCIAAELALDQDEEIAAAEALTQAIELIPNALRVQALQSRLAQRRGDLPVALQILQHALSELNDNNEADISPLAPLANTILALGITASDLEQWETALNLLERAAAEADHEPLPAVYYARTFVLRAEYQRLCQALDSQAHAPGAIAIDQKAYQAFQTALQSAFNRLPDDLRTAPPRLYARWEARGKATFELNPENLQEFEAVLQTQDDDGAWLGLIAQGGDLIPVNQAYSAIREKYQGAPSHPSILVQIALSKGLKGRRQEDLNDSLVAMQSAIDQRPHQPLYHAILSRLAGVANNPALALHAILTALSFWPDEPRWHSQAASLYLDSGDAPAAISHLEKAVTLDPAYLPNYLALGQAHLQIGQPTQAIDALEQSVKVAPDQSDGYMALASAYLAMGNLSKASTSADGAINAAQHQLPPLLLRADIALQMNDPAKARTCAEQVLRLQPDHPVALHQCAQALHQLGLTEQAMQVVQRAIPLAVDPLPLLIEQTSLLESLHGHQANLNALQELALQYPDDPAVLAPLAKALAQNNEQEEAIRTAQRALRGGSHTLRPREQAGLHHLLGRLLHQTGQLDQAIHQFSEAIRLAPEQVEVYLDLGETQLERRQNTLAIQTYQKAIQIAPEDPRPFHQAGLAFKASRDYPGAETMLRHAAELAPEDLAIHRQLAALVALNLVHSRRPVPMDT